MDFGGDDAPPDSPGAKEEEFECPVCSTLVPGSQIEEHVQRCLSDPQTAHGEPAKAPATRNAPPSSSPQPGGAQQVQQWAELAILRLESLLRDPTSVPRKELEALEAALDGHVKHIGRVKASVM